MELFKAKGRVSDRHRRALERFPSPPASWINVHRCVLAFPMLEVLERTAREYSRGPYEPASYCCCDQLSFEEGL